MKGRHPGARWAAGPSSAPSLVSAHLSTVDGGAPPGDSRLFVRGDAVQGRTVW